MGKRKLTLERIENDQYRIVSFSKRRKGLFKKATELSALTGAQTVALVVSEAGIPYAAGDLSVVDRFFGISSGETQQDDGEAFAVSSSDDSKNSDGSSSSSFSEFLNAKVDECDRIDELLGLREKLEEMRKNVSLAMDLRFADSLIA